jgi:hypothetical protein
MRSPWYEYLKDVLTRLQSATNHTVDELTPIKWKEARAINVSRAAYTFCSAEKTRKTSPNPAVRQGVAKSPLTHRAAKTFPIEFSRSDQGRRSLICFRL